MTLKQVENKLKTKFLTTMFVGRYVMREDSHYRISYGNTSNHNGAFLEDVWIDFFPFNTESQANFAFNSKKLSKQFITWARKNDFFMPEVYLLHTNNVDTLRFTITFRLTL